MVVSFRNVGVRGGRLLAGLLALAVMASCGGSDGGTEPETPRPTTLVLTPSTVALSYIGASTTVTARILDQDGSPMTGAVTWVSDTPAVATVISTGMITAVSNGTATVRATSGSLSATVAVTVQQVATSLAVVSGNAQSGNAGEPLSEAVVVLAKDQGGTAVAGVPVTFTPDPGSGTVSVSSTTTDSEGQASTVWTMGSSFGPQQLIARVESGPSVGISANSLSPFPLPDLVTTGTLVLSRPDPSNLETFTVQATVRNAGNASTGQAFRVRLLSDGVEIASENVASLAVDGSKTFTFDVGPSTVGNHPLRFEVDPDGVIEELIESNNALTRDVRVVLQTPVNAGTTLNGLNAQENVELLYRLDLPVSANNLTVELSGGTGDVDLFMKAGVRPSNRDDYNDCQSGSPTTTERCQLTGVTPGTYHILLHAFSTFSGTTMNIRLDGEVLPFNIEVVFIDHGTAAQDAVFIQAAERWMSILPVDVPDSDFSNDPYEADQCLEGQPIVSDVVDDIRIYVSIDSIDGPSQVLARATPCVTRGLGNLPILGFMEFDEADMDGLASAGELLPVVLHEMGHVLGVGTIWGIRGFLKDPSRPSSPGVDTHFTGAGAIEAFDAAGGTAYTAGQKVPVENTADEGSADGHWRESVLRRELMTPFFNSGQQNPLSAITVRSLADLGYQVDVTKADAFTGITPAPSRVAGSTDRLIDLSGDMVRRPIVAVDQKGRIKARVR